MITSQNPSGKPGRTLKTSNQSNLKRKRSFFIVCTTYYYLIIVCSAMCVCYIYPFIVPFYRTVNTSLQPTVSYSYNHIQLSYMLCNFQCNCLCQCLNVPTLCFLYHCNLYLDVYDWTICLKNQVTVKYWPNTSVNVQYMLIFVTGLRGYFYFWFCFWFC